MADTVSKIRIKLGQIEVDYEGAHAFLREDLPALLETILKLREQSGEGDQSDSASNGDGVKKAGGVKLPPGTAGDVAARLKVADGPDLIIATLAKHILIDGQETVTRKALLASMRTATAYFKQSYSTNLTRSLNKLSTDQRVTEPSAGKFALSANERTALETRLAG